MIGEQLAELIVELLDQAHVGRDHALAHFVAREGAADARLLISGVDRMIGLALGFRAHRRQDVLLAVHVVIGRRHDIGPVRLDVGEMAQPGLVAGLVHEVHRPLRHVGRLGMLVGHARRQVAVAHEPAGEDFAVVAFRRVGPFLPRIAAEEAVLAQVIVVSADRDRRARRGAGRRRARTARSRIPTAARRSASPDRCRATPCPWCRGSCGSCRPAPRARRAGAGGRPASARRRAAESRSRSSRASGNSGRCNSSCARGRRTATARRRRRSARPWPPAHRDSACADADGRNRTGNPTAIGRP